MTDKEIRDIMTSMVGVMVNMLEFIDPSRESPPDAMEWIRDDITEILQSLEHPSVTR